MVLPTAGAASFHSRVSLDPGGDAAASMLHQNSRLDSAPSQLVATSELFELLKANYADRLASVARAAGSGVPLEKERVSGAAGRRVG